MELKGNIKGFPLPDIVQLLGGGRKTGMLLIVFGKNKAKMYFDKGNIVHAEMMKTKGIDAVSKMIHITEGRFHFYADLVPDAQTFNMSPIMLLMQALSTYDENREARGAFDKSGKKGKSHEKKVKNLKKEMITVVKGLYGNKAKKIEQLINKCGNSEIELMSSCDKIEKYIFVFLDSHDYKDVADRLRHLIEETY